MGSGSLKHAGYNGYDWAVTAQAADVYAYSIYFISNIILSADYNFRFLGFAVWIGGAGEDVHMIMCQSNPMV